MRSLRRRDVAAVYEEGLVLFVVKRYENGMNGKVMIQVGLQELQECRTVQLALPMSRRIIQ